MAAVRGLLGLLAALLFCASVVLVWRDAAGPSLSADCAASAAVCGGGATAIHEPSGATTAVPPPGDDDPARPHQDPGVWPDLVFILGLFAFALVMRGTRPRRTPAAAPDRIER
jgi:hypothetical protein